MKSVVLILSLEKVWHCLQQLIVVRICTCVTKRSVLLFLSDSSSPNNTYGICTLGDSRLNRLKTIPFTAADTYIAHIWQYPPPTPEYFLLSPVCCTKIINNKKNVMVYTTLK